MKTDTTKRTRTRATTAPRYICGATDDVLLVGDRFTTWRRERLYGSPEAEREARELLVAALCSIEEVRRG
jgi:hypothetical protein